MVRTLKTHWNWMYLHCAFAQCMHGQWCSKMFMANHPNCVHRHFTVRVSDGENGDFGNRTQNWTVCVRFCVFVAFSDFDGHVYAVFWCCFCCACCFCCCCGYCLVSCLIFINTANERRREEEKKQQLTMYGLIDLCAYTCECEWIMCACVRILLSIQIHDNWIECSGEEGATRLHGSIRFM